ncbi:LytR/AlgR family response regulator transcription factor [Paraclostridium sordellii]|uniref:LytR/AlgR family response regulator transcription factor n=1 Tax=Paraclostridium sordellii TaxID=1505 RepID=UPI001899F702|nr:LytTR family DNA-binding domain-containing protein [Paeniclostridium sordellii]
MNLSIVICEDDLNQMNLLVYYLNEIFKNKVLGYTILQFSSGEELLRNYPDRVDILFLDIQMAKLTGIETARKIREFDSTVEIVFTTALLDYIHEGYEVRAYRYLLKPLNYANLLKHTNSCIEDILDKNDTIVIKDRRKTIVLLIDKILYIEVLKKELTIYTEEESYTVKMSMKSIENNLLKKAFFRCHKSFLINLRRVSSFKENAVIIRCNEIPVSRYRYKNFKIELANILGDILC